MPGDWFDEFLDAIEASNVKVRFWVCPVKGHSDGTARPGRRIQTVEWVDGVATCLFPGCGRTSTDPVPRGECLCEEDDCEGECCGVGCCTCTPAGSGEAA